MANFVSNSSIERHVKNLSKKWKKNVLDSNLDEIKRYCTLNTASFGSVQTNHIKYPTNEKEADIFIKERIKIWLTNITDCVEAIEETTIKHCNYE